MRKNEIERVLQQIARTHHTTAEQVRKEMLLAMKEAQQSKDPNVQKLWASIPRKGNSPTLEEFIEYLAKQVSL